MNRHMTDTSNHNSEAFPAAEEQLPDFQYKVMNDLVDLSEDRAPAAEAAVENEFQTAAEKEHAAHKRRIAGITRRRDNVIAQGQSKYDAVVQNIVAESRRVIERLEEEKQRETRKDSHAAMARESQAKQKLDQDIWLADSLVEATKTHLGTITEKLHKDAATQKESLEELEHRAVEILDLYHFPIPEPAEAPTDPDGESDEPEFHREYEAARKKLAELGNHRTAGLFIGPRPWLAAILPSLGICALATLLTHFTAGPVWAFLVAAPSSLGLTLGTIVWAGSLIKNRARKEVGAIFGAFRAAVERGRDAIDRSAASTYEKLEQIDRQVEQQRESEVNKARAAFEQITASHSDRHQKSTQQIAAEYDRKIAAAEAERDRKLEAAAVWTNTDLPAIENRYARYCDQAAERHDAVMQRIRGRRDRKITALKSRWNAGLARIEQLAEHVPAVDRRLFPPWDAPAWKKWVPGEQAIPVIRFGAFALDMKRIASIVHRYNRLGFDRSLECLIPAMLAFPARCSLLLQSDRTGLEEGVGALQSTMMRLLTCLPPGNVHFTILDPVGLGQNFAGFMHLADYDETLVGGRIWTTEAHIEQRLKDLTDHMENVIQKYLRNEFQSIDEYNRQAGELAEPYRFLVTANFPVNFSEEAARNLTSIVTSGPRCGVYTLLLRDTREELPPAIAIEELEEHSVTIVRDEHGWTWKDPLLSRFPLALDRPPEEEHMTRITHRVGAAAQEASRVEVPFTIIAPDKRRWWKETCDELLSVPIGRSGATRNQYLRLGEGVAQHALIIGKTGSGKSTLLHVIITSCALWYSPEEVNFYLVDFKKGVEFKTYASHDLPHAKVIAIESDREFGLSVLRKLNDELERRGELFREAEVQDLAMYRDAVAAPDMPRTLLVIDEFQVLFAEDDKIAYDAAMLLDRLVRQGRAFGIHVILGSQSLGGSAGLARSTIGQMAVRLVLQCSETDSQLALDDSNTAARLLSRPGEAIYNDAGGMVEGNNPFQTAWLPDGEREKLLSAVRDRAKKEHARAEPLVVFEGSAPADIRHNHLLAERLAAGAAKEAPDRPVVWIGEAVAITDPTAVRLPRQNGANLLLVGRRDDAATSILAVSFAALAAQFPVGAASFVVFDTAPSDTAGGDILEQLAGGLPHPHRTAGNKDAGDVIAELHAEMTRRRDAEETDDPAIFLLLRGFQKFRAIRKPDDFAFAADDAGEEADPGTLLRELLADGPPVGIHTIAWADTLASLERAVGSRSLKEFDNRALFQMSADDSSSLIDTPLANRLGFYRAILYSEERGTFEKFRPYSPPDADWIKGVHSALKPTGKTRRSRKR